MQEDASYYALISSVQPQEERLQTTKHQRKASLLAQPNVGLGVITYAQLFSDAMYRRVPKLMTD